MNYSRFWEMRQFTGKHNKPAEVFKCVDCGATTHHEDGFNGEPDTHKCSDKCQCSHGDWKVGGATNKYKDNFDRIFPDSPGAGL